MFINSICKVKQNSAMRARLTNFFVGFSHLRNTTCRGVTEASAIFPHFVLSFTLSSSREVIVREIRDAPTLSSVLR